MHPVVNEIRDALRGIYPDSEALALAKMLLVEVFGFTTLELYGGKDKEISVKDRDVLDEMIARLKKNGADTIYNRCGTVLWFVVRG